MMKDFIKVTGSENGKTLLIPIGRIIWVDTVAIGAGERTGIKTEFGNVKCTETPEEIAALIEAAQEETPTSGNIIFNAPLGCASPEEPNPLTNGDKIRAMTNEELARIISCGGCRQCALVKTTCGIEPCEIGIAKWLNQEETT